MKTRVLMFGWEFPPHIAGGLGTACLGLTRGLAKQGVEVLFVMPKASGDEDQSAAKIINASDVESLYQYHDVEEYWKNIDFMEGGSNAVYGSRDIYPGGEKVCSGRKRRKSD